jgi:hypothetical protein
VKIRLPKPLGQARSRRWRQGQPSPTPLRPTLQ